MSKTMQLWHNNLQLQKCQVTAEVSWQLAIVIQFHHFNFSFWGQQVPEDFNFTSIFQDFFRDYT